MTSSRSRTITTSFLAWLHRLLHKMKGQSITSYEYHLTIWQKSFYVLPYVKLFANWMLFMTKVCSKYNRDDMGFLKTKRRAFLRGVIKGTLLNSLHTFSPFFLFSTLTPTFQGTSALSDTVIINWKWYFQRNWQTWHFIIFVNTCHKWLLVRKFHFPLSISNQI